MVNNVLTKKNNVLVKSFPYERYRNTQRSLCYMCVCVSFGEDKDIDKYENNIETNVEIYK